MVDITEISAMVAAAGVLVGVVYYILDMRNQHKIRKTDLVIRISSFGTRRDFLEACTDIFESEFKDYGDFVRKYGAPFSKKPMPMSFSIVGNFMERVGMLLKNGLLDVSLISQLVTVADFWEKMKPVIEGIRKEEHKQSYYEYFEYLYNEMKKREQKLQQSTEAQDSKNLTASRSS
jgi:hypothetical protein